jgi:hypothetical protein
MTSPVNVKKPRSPATPSFSLKEAVEKAKTVYGKLSHAKFSQAELASALGLSSSSGHFSQQVFTLTEFGLVERSGDSYEISKTFHILDDTKRESAEFKTAAMAAIRGSAVFADLIKDFSTKIPSKDVVAQRLEKQRGFNADRAKAVAVVFQASLEFAGVVDASNNLLPIREQAARDGSSDVNPAAATSDTEEHALAPPRGLRKTEVPLLDGRVAVVHYPHDLSATEATKIGNVLAALVG